VARGLSCGSSTADALRRTGWASLGVAAVAGSLYSTASLLTDRRSTGALTRTTGATASPTARLVTSYRGNAARTGRDATTTLMPE
jgi:hypothetical protein